MPKQDFFAFNRGLVSKFGLARVSDIDRVKLSASVQTNWLSYVLGRMALRTGTGDLGNTKSDRLSRHIPFVYSLSDTAIIELTDVLMRIRVDDTIVTRPVVASALTNSEFTTNLSGWTDASGAGASTAWVTGGYAGLTGSGFNSAILRQTLTVTGGDINTEHGIKFIISRGVVGIRVGTSLGGNEYFELAALEEGEYHLSFTPTGGTVYLEMFADDKYQSFVDELSISSGGDVEIIAPWTESDLDCVRHEQSADVVFVGCYGKQQYTIRRYGIKSWGIARHYTRNGSFKAVNLTKTRMSPSAVSGDVVITATDNYFSNNHVGALIKIPSISQYVISTFNGASQEGSPVRVTGVGGTRNVDVSITGTFVMTVTLQRSVGAIGSWTNVESYTVPTTKIYNDALDNQIIYYRLVVGAGDYTSGSAVSSLLHASGSDDGIARITSYISPTQVNAMVLQEFYGYGTPMQDWYIGQWSDVEGYPTSPLLEDGRLWWFGNDGIWASVSDDYTNMDTAIEGNSAAISRTIGFGAVDKIEWALPLKKMMLGGESNEYIIQSSDYGEAITGANLKVRYPSSQGSYSAAAIMVDDDGFFIQRSGKKLHLAAYDGRAESVKPVDMTLLVPDLVGSYELKKLFVIRQPDTRIYAISTSGDLFVLTFDTLEEVRSWVKIETNGTIEDGFVIPAREEDRLYIQVLRNGNQRRLEKFALESECKGLAMNKMFDSAVYYDGVATNIITGLTHLNGMTVRAWGDSEYLGEYTVSGGQVTLSKSVAKACVGLSYKGSYVSNKLSWINNGAASQGTSYGQEQRIGSLTLLVADTHSDGLRFGQDTNYLEKLPTYENGQVVTSRMIDLYEETSIPINGSWDAGCRLIVECESPYPASVLGIVMDLEINEKS